MSVCLCLDGKTTACGISRATAGALQHTEHRLAVTCEACKATKQFEHTIQRIPRVLGGPYRYA